ncbi:hypothetical protein SDC9_71133 [bioreactor metagenome]|uniref:Uncharacterized protein n=1 Tax=bioreactor metagenome TaxID=1076179 RepID=A0A644Y861_9ZZZZ
MADLLPGADRRIADDSSELPSFRHLVVGIRLVDFHIADVVGFRISARQRQSPLVYIHHLHQSSRISMRERKPHRTVTAADIQDIPGHFLIQAEAFDQQTRTKVDRFFGEDAAVRDETEFTIPQRKSPGCFLAFGFRILCVVMI